MVMITERVRTQENPVFHWINLKHKMCKSVQVAAAGLTADNEKLVR